MENVVRRIVIEKLHDVYDYDITFDKGGVTLITGPNGYGKTTLLKIIKNALDINFWYFFDLHFASICIYFGDDTILDIKKVSTDSERSEQILFPEDSKDNVLELASDEILFEVFIEHIDKNGNGLDKIKLGRRKFLYLLERYARFAQVDGHTLSIDLTPADIENISSLDKDLRKQFTVLRMFAQEHTCLFVKEQRIIEGRKKNISDNIGDFSKFAITQLAESIKDMYQQKQSEYADKSQQIDSTFIQRQIQKMHETYSEEVYQEKLGRLKQKIAAYEYYGLIDKYNLVEVYKKELGMTLSMHIDDMFDKFSVYDDFYSKLKRFDDFVSGKGLSNKRMILDPKNGITFMSDSGRVIPLYNLSSGEQNLVILYFRLIFETNNQTLFLLDEPENSIHVEWLEKMLDDYLEMQDILGCQMMIATHSVTFVNGHWDKAYDLFGGSYQDWMEK